MIWDDGLLVVEADAADRRSRRVRLTTAGHAVLLRTLPIWNQTHTETGSTHPDVDMDQLRMSLRELGSDAAP